MPYGYYGTILLATEKGTAFRVPAYAGAAAGAACHVAVRPEFVRIGETAPAEIAFLTEQRLGRLATSMNAPYASAGTVTSADPRRVVINSRPRTLVIPELVGF